MKKIIALALLMVCSLAHAMTDDEYVKAVGKNIKRGAFALSVGYGTLRNEVQVTEHGAILRKKSKNPEFDAEILRAANAALDGTVASGLVFPVEYIGPRSADMNKLNRQLGAGDE